jgi:spoIIIJ-associated protein
MEWVEVRGESVAAAEELALDQLGVAREDAEFEVVQAPESRWMGLKKTEARVRARVRPSTPPPKTERRPRRNGRGASGSDSPGADGGRSEGGKSRRGGSRSKGGGGSKEGRGGDNRNEQPKRQPAQSEAASTSEAAPKSDGGQQRAPKQAVSASETPDNTDAGRNRRGPAHKEKSVSENQVTEEMPMAEQQETLDVFLRGIVAGFGVEATASTTVEEDGTLVGSIDGTDVGLMVGPQAGTLRAIQELARTSMQRSAGGRDTARLMVDVGGYRERRRAALTAFVTKVAQEVRETGESIALDTMGSADRKQVHDAVAELDGVHSSSSGRDPHRFVVIHPGDAD